ncbi:MAG: GDP-mannose 4,6-dehydratase [Alphaproteobacteria bacterium]|nr:GDP-mannose 4,6-dehydratase [Alphaproteobacteria bacterium]
MRYRHRRVLVTGPDGFMGTPLCEGLVREGADVRALVQYGAGTGSSWLDQSPASPRVRRVPGDIRDPDTVARAAEGVDLIFHLAALSTVPWSLQAPGSYVQTNIVGTYNVLQVARNLGARVVLASSSQVYGVARYVPIDEAHPLEARSPYAASKIAQEKLVESWHHGFGLDATILRTFFTYGPRQSLRNIVPTVITQLLAGPHIKLGNLHPERDFVHVDDQIEGYLAAGVSDAVNGRTLNLSGRELISIGGLVERVGRILGIEPIVETDPARVRSKGTEINAVSGDSTLARELLGWTPGIDIDAGLEKCVDWYRSNLSAYASVTPGVV